MPNYAELFRAPSVESMYALTPQQFEHFVAYVLQRAGYDVKEVGPHFLHGVDIEMRLPGKTRIFGGVECKKFASDNLVKANVVSKVKGAASVSKPGAKSFVVTTSDFNGAAHQVAVAGNKHAYLLNGSQLVRYINYIRGSRHDDEDVLTSISPEFFAGRDGVDSPSMGSAKILTVANNKGGVGKTTTAYYLAGEFSHRGMRVLLIDLDGQANLTERCIPSSVDTRNEENDHFPSIAQYFAGEQTLANLITSAETAPGVSLIPSDPFLTLRDLGGSGRPDVELQFMRDVRELSLQPIATLGGIPDWIIIDTPPAISTFTRAGLAAATHVIAPLRPRNASLTGTLNMLETLQTMTALTGGASGKFLGAVITHWDDLKSSRLFIDTRLQPRLPNYGGQTFETMIPIDNQLETLQPGAKTEGAKKYTALADEIIDVVFKLG